MLASVLHPCFTICGATARSTSITDSKIVHLIKSSKISWQRVQKALVIYAINNPLDLHFSLPEQATAPPARAALRWRPPARVLRWWWMGVSWRAEARFSGTLWPTRVSQGALCGCTASEAGAASKHLHLHCAPMQPCRVHPNKTQAQTGNPAFFIPSSPVVVGVFVLSCAVARDMLVYMRPTFLSWTLPCVPY